MKNLIIRSGSLRMGGLERVLIEVLKTIDKNKYHLCLIIEDDSGDANVFLDQVPTEIPVYFLKNKEIVAKRAYYRARKKSFFYKILYNLYSVFERRVVLDETQKVICKVEKEFGPVDVFLDYDWGARHYVEKLEARKKVIWIHNSLPGLLKKTSKIKRFGKNLDKYDVVVGICDEMKEEMQTLYPFLKDKVTRVYNPFNFDRILRLSEDQSQLNVDEQQLLEQDYILAVSRLDTVQKDYKTLLKGYALAVKLGIQEQLYIVGDGSGRAQIEEMISEYGLNEKVVMIGRTTNPYVWMKNANLFVHSSFYEGFGLVLVEAMICGRVALCSNCLVGPTEVLGNGKYGALFDVGDDKGLAEKLVQLLSNKEALQKYENVLEEQINKFNSQNIIKEYEKIIDTAV